MELPRFNPVSGATELINNQFRIAEGYQNIFARAQAYKQSAESFEMEKQRFATNQTLAQLNITQGLNQIRRQNNQLELEEYSLEADKLKIDQERAQAQAAIDAGVANEALLAEAPKFFASVLNKPNLSEDEVDQAIELFNAKFGHLTTDAKYASRFQQAVGPHFESLIRHKTLAANARERRAAQWLIQITKAEVIRDPMQRDAELSRIVENPEFLKAVGGNGPRSQALFQKWSQMAGQMAQNNATLDRVDAAGRTAAAVAQAKAGAGKQLPQFIFEKMSKITQAKDDINQLKQAYSSGNWGPIVGRIKGLNPWDVDVAKLEALLNAAVPNLARGVFGEVGVLTNVDVENYKKLLPNTKSPEAAAKALVGMLEQKLSAAYGQTMKRAKGQGYNTGGFEDTLDEETDTTVTADDILSAAGARGP